MRYAFRRGAAGQEYAVMVGLIAVLALAALSLTGGNVRRLFLSTSNILGASTNLTVGQTGGGGSGGGGGPPPTSGAFGWGDNAYGQLPGAGSTPTAPAALNFVSGTPSRFVAANNFSCMLIGSQVRCVGDGTAGQLGNGSFSSSTTIVTVGGLTSPTELGAGSGYACAIDGSVAKCWGRGQNGRLGNGVSDSANPLTVQGLTGSVSQLYVGSGGASNCITDSTGIKCWGDNTYGQLATGSNSTVTYSSAVSASLLSPAPSLMAMGPTFGCGVFSGTTRCWGWGTNNQMGNSGFTGINNALVTVNGLSGTPSVIKSGWYHSCAIIGGAVSCWGYNASGQLGNGTSSAQTTAVTATGISGATTLATGYVHSCAATSQNVYCWGDNASGQLGDGTTTARNVPTLITTLSGSPTIFSIGYLHSMALIP